MKCSRLKCHRVASILGLCRSHWDTSVRNGVNGLISSEAAAQRIGLLQELRWTCEGISKAAGLAGSAVRGVLVRTQILRSTERAILAVPLVPYVSSSIAVPSLGLDRRRKSLAFMGWPLATLAPMAGTSPQVVCNAISNGKVSLPLHLAFVELYAVHQHEQGPSKWTASWAKTQGFHPPFAWEYTDIDDPKAKPFQGFNTRRAA